MNSLILDHLREGIDFVESHLHQPIELRSVSTAAAMSPRSFQRTFKAVTGETLKSYIRARRLSHALALLESTDETILDVAIAAGYETQESFAKAFKTTMDITPSQYRQGERVKKSLKKVRIDEAYLEHLGSGMISPEPSIEQREEMVLLGVATRYDGEERRLNTLGQNLDELWFGYLSVLELIPDRVEVPLYGLIQDGDGSDDGLDYLAAELTTATVAPAGMSFATVPGGRWALFTHHGLPSDLDHTVNYIYGSWLVRSEEQHSGGPDLEIYGTDWQHDSPDSVIHYAVPLA